MTLKTPSPRKKQTVRLETETSQLDVLRLVAILRLDKKNLHHFR